MFCGGQHYHDECQQFTSREARRSILIRNNQYFICLRTGHRCRECPNRQRIICAHCSRRGLHHRAICPSRKSITAAQNPLQMETKTPHIEDTDSTVVVSNSRQMEDNCNLCHHTADQPCQVGHSLSSSSNSNVLLQTAVVDLESMNGASVSKGRLLFDSGSHHSFITKHMAELLQLQPMRTESLRISTFGSGRYRQMSSAVVKLGLRTKDGSLI